MKTETERSVRREHDVFRAVNEKLRDLNLEFERFANERAMFVCECDQLDCTAQIELGVDEFDAICSHVPRRYVVMPGHEVAGTERVLALDGAYVVVERISQ